MTSLCTTLLRSRARRTRSLLFGWLLTLLAMLAGLLTPHNTHAAPQLILPTPPGEEWRIIQGYGCGTHNAWDRYSLDLTQVQGSTYGAPIRAAMGGEIWHWEGGSGTLILSHGDQFFTMYTHMQRAVTSARGHYFAAGETLGFAGDRGSPGVPHLHFTAYTANRDGWSGKQSVPLRFAEGYDLPEVGGCNQHGGTLLKAMSLQPPQVTFRGQAEAGKWYNAEQRIEFTTTWAGGGLSQKWNQEPVAAAPMFPHVIDGYALLSEAGEGMHTLYVRVWGPDGKQALASFGPLGYDTSPPAPPGPIGDLKLVAGTQAQLSWAASSDAGAGVAGYRVYVGPDLHGKADWFTAEPAVKTPALQPGHYVVRVQALDKAGNSGSWATLGSITVA